jgi:argininosuccinate synthase
MDKIVPGYSSGLETLVAIPWLAWPEAPEDVFVLATSPGDAPAFGGGD